MHLLVQTLIAEARRRGANVDPVSHWDDLQELDLFAHGVTERPVDERLALLDRPINVGPIQVRRLSEMAREWLADCVSWWPAKDPRIDRAVAWAHVYGRSRVMLDRVAGQAAAERELSAWARHLPVPLETLLVAAASLQSEAEHVVMAGDANKHLRRVLRDLETLTAASPERVRDAVRSLSEVLAIPPAQRSDPRAVGQLYAALIETYHQPLEYWLLDVSSDQLGIMVDALIDRKQAEAVVGTLPNGQPVTAGDRRRLTVWTKAKCLWLDKLGIRNKAAAAEGKTS